MRLEIKGSFEADDIQSTVEDAVGVWLEKLENDNPEMKETFKQVENLYATSVTVDLAFKMSGVAEPQVLTTDNHEGIPELLVVTAETDSQGNLLWDSVKDNDGDSLFSEAEALIATGLTGRREEIVSDYLNAVVMTEEYIDIDSTTAVNVAKVGYEAVVQLLDKSPKEGTYRPILFAEVAFPVEEYDNLVTHYKKLAEVTTE